MYTYEIAVVGGQGGGQFSHADSKEMVEAGCCIGAGANGMRLSTLHVEKWQVLSHNYGTYTCIKDPSKKVTTAGVGNIRNKSEGQDFEIPLDHRVQRVCVSAGALTWAAGAHCLNFLEIQTAPVTDSKASKVTSIGACHRSQQQRQEPGTHGQHAGSHNSPYCQVVRIPEGLTLAGIAGRNGDSWDQIRLLVCPWLPEGGVWSSTIHKHLVTPFKQQVRALLLCMHQLRSEGLVMDRNLDMKLAAALFDVTFMADQPVKAAVTSTAAAAAAAAAAVTGSAAGAGRKSSRRLAKAAAAAAPAAASDFVGVWMQQQVQQARQESETALNGPSGDDYSGADESGSGTGSDSRWLRVQ